MKPQALALAFLTLSCSVIAAHNTRQTTSYIDTIPVKTLPEGIKAIQILNITKDKVQINNPGLVNTLDPEILYIGIDNIVRVTANEPLTDIGASVENASLTKTADDVFVLRVNNITDVALTFYIQSAKGKMVVMKKNYPVRAIPMQEKKL